MNELIALALALIAHELGHYVHFAICGFRPKFEWVGIGPCVTPQEKILPAKYVILNATAAIFIGMAVLTALKASHIAVFAYIVGCFLDLNNIQMLLIYIWRKTITFNTNVNDIKIMINNKVIA